MKQMNVLFLGGAKRVEMAMRFVEAGKRLGVEVNIYSYEINERVPIAAVGTVVIGRRWSDPDVLADMKDVVDANDISVIVPFVDGAVAVAARYAAAYPDTVFVPAGDPALAESMFDKVVAAMMFEKASLPIPETYVPGMPRLKLIAKPRHGSASKGIVLINSLEQLDRILDRADEYLIQERIDDRTEITVDCYVSVRSGEILAAVPRVRNCVSGGEVSESTTIHDAKVEELARRTLAALNLRGAVTVQIIRDNSCDAEENLMIMEINPRLGGGAVLSVEAGADIPMMILREALGMDNESCLRWRDVFMTRYQLGQYFEV
jgi:carbamoyl-phosphate synthase large subunit